MGHERPAVRANCQQPCCRSLISRDIFHVRRLKEVFCSDKQLYLVFEWIDKDLKKYMDAVPTGLSHGLIKVCEILGVAGTFFHTAQCLPRHFVDVELCNGKSSCAVRCSPTCTSCFAA